MSGSHADDSSVVLRNVFYHLRCRDLPHSVLSRGVTPRQKWAGNGSIVSYLLHESGASIQLSTLFADMDVLQSALASIIRDGFIERSDHAPGVDSMLHPTAKLNSLDPGDDQARDALYLISHIFPLEEALEQR